MASLRKRSGGTWQVRWRQDGVMQSQSFPDRKGAVRFKGLVEGNDERWPEHWVRGHGFLRPGSEPDPRGTTLAQWFQRWLDSNARAQDCTKRDFGLVFARSVPPWLADKPVAEITREDAGTWLLELRRRTIRRGGRLVPVSEGTSKRAYTIVKAAMRAAKADGLTDRSPFDLNIVWRDRVPEQAFLDEAEFGLILGEAIQHGAKDAPAALTLAFRTGLRVGELCGLEPRHIDLDRMELTVEQAWQDHTAALAPTKTVHSNRTIALGERDVALLLPYVERGAEALFLNNDGHRLRPTTLRSKTWLPAVSAAREHGLAKTPRIHDLRHSHAAYLLSHGVPLLAVSRRLGHGSPMVTGMIYAHVLPAVDDTIRGLL